MQRGRIMGGVLMLMGLLALAEAWQLYTLRTAMVAGAVVGDDTMPMIVGLAAVVLASYSLWFATFPAIQVRRPPSAVRHQMLWGAGILIAYCAVLPYLGYTGSTALGSAALFRGMGGYRWAASLLLGGITTATLYLLFRVWLLQPLPTGVLGL
jgi:hypothetical protein